MKNFVGSARNVGFWLALASAFGLLAAGVANAQERGVKIRSIEVQYSGPETISRERILAQIRTKVGQNYSDAVAEQDIRALA